MYEDCTDLWLTSRSRASHQCLALNNGDCYAVHGASLPEVDGDTLKGLSTHCLSTLELLSNSTRQHTCQVEYSVKNTIIL